MGPAAGPGRGRSRVLLVHPLSSRQAEQRLEAAVEVVRGGAGGRDELARLLADADAVVLRPPSVLDAELLRSAPRLKVIGNIGTGLDHIDLAEAQRRGVPVVAGRGGNANAVAEYVTGMILAVGHRLFAARDYMTGDPAPWGTRLAQLRGQELRRRTLGILGLGAIGRRLAEIVTGGLEMRVLAYDPLLATAGDAPATLVGSLEELCRSSDVLSVHVPLTASTRSMLGAGELALLPPGALVVNTSRGGVVDEPALFEALVSGRLGAAVLDVFADEPPGDERRREFALVPNLYCTPHIAGVTEEAGEALCAAAVDGVLEHLGAR